MAELIVTRWLRPGMYSLANRMATVILGFINIFILVRISPPTEVGVWVLFTSVTGILETLRNGFIRNPLISKLVIAEGEEREHIVRASFFLHLILAIVTSLLLLTFGTSLASFWRTETLSELFYLYAINSIVLVFYLHFEYLLQSKLEFKAIFLANILRLSFLTILMLVFFFSNAHPKLHSLVLAQLFGTLLGVGLSYFLLRSISNLKVSFNVRFSDLASLFHFGKYTFGTNISSMFIKNTDSWMIGRFISATGVALYNPAIRIANIVEVPTLAIANVVFPQVSSKLKESGVEGIKDIYYKSVALILAIMLPVIFPLFFYSDWVIVMLFGEDYLSAASILKVTVFYMLIIPFNRQFGTIMDALQMPKVNFYLLLVIALLNVCFNYFFLSSYGIIGAAYGTVLAYSIVFISNQIILYRMYKISTFRVFIEILNWYQKIWRQVVRSGGKNE